MKYPAQQFELLKKGLAILAEHFELGQIHPCQIHYLLYQQAGEGQKQNSLCINEAGQICKKYVVDDLGLNGYSPLIPFLNDDNFKLYPEGCNDNHVETAVKRALAALN